MMPRTPAEIAYARQHMEIENARHTDEFVRIRNRPSQCISAWRNNRFLVQLYDDNGFLRLSISTTALNETGDRWADGITWDELMDVKRGVGFGARWAVEVYPADIEVVNVANIRHLFLMPEPPVFAWRTTGGEA